MFYVFQEEILVRKSLHIGLNPGLAAMIAEIGYLLLPSCDMAEVTL